MNNIKRIIALLLAVVMTAAIMVGCGDQIETPVEPGNDVSQGVVTDPSQPTSDQTEDIPPVVDPPVDVSPADGSLGDPISDNGWGYMMSIIKDERYLTVMNQIFEGIKNFELSIKVDPVLTPEETNDFINVILSNIPVEYSFVGGFGAKAYSDNTNLAGVLASVEVNYNVNTIEEGLDMVAQLRTAADAVIGNIKDSWSDYQKIKYIHDWLILNCTPDENDKGGPWGPTAYGAIVDGRPTCLGYGKAMLYLLDRAGYDCAFVVGKGHQAKHIWVTVNVGDSWYCIDPTWDDPYDITKVDPEYVEYDYFMVPDSFMARTHAEVYDMALYDAPVADSEEYCWHNVENQYAKSYDEAVTILKDSAKNAVNNGGDYEYVRIKFPTEELYLQVKDEFTKSKFASDVLADITDKYTLAERYLGSTKWTLTYVLKKN